MEQGILSGIKVLELASVLAGPSVGMFLAELGARVIKVEHFKAGGDVTRTWKLKSESAETDRPAYFCAVNWGKESMGIDLSTRKGQALVHRLVKHMDIVLVSYKPGDAVKLNMDAGTLRGINVRLIYAALTAYGEDDGRPGFDAIIQAEAGFTYMNGAPDGGPVKMPVALMDVLAAHQLKEGILLALLKRERTGEGSVVSASLIHTALASLVNQATNYLVGGSVPQRIGSEHPNIVPYGTIFETGDGKAVVLAVGSDGHFKRLCATIGAGELGEDARFVHNQGRVAHRRELNALLAGRIKAWERDVLLKALEAAGVPAGAVFDMAEALAQDAAGRLMIEGEGLRALRSVAFELDGVDQRVLDAPPHLGAGTVSILKEDLGLEDGEIQELYGEAIISTDGNA